MPGPTPSRRLVSVVLSFRNEEPVLPEVIRRISSALEPLALDFELIFVNDASTDRSLEVLREAAARDPRVKIINMSRRFGASECVLAGMSRASGDAVVYLDTDLQDPPELIPRLISEWLKGADVVHTVRTSRAGEPPLKLWLTAIAYRLINLFSDTPFPIEAGDFKLLSRRAVRELLSLGEHTPYLRGLVAWIGFRQVTVPYDRLPRARGESQFPIFRHFLKDLMTLQGPMGHLVVGLTSFSLLPIILVLLGGLALSALGACVGALALCPALGGRGSLAVAAAVLGAAGLQMLALAVIGIYVGRVYQDARARPRYIIESSVGFD